MHNTRVVMKDGSVLFSPILKYRPEEGYMQLLDSPRKLLFSEIESAITEDGMPHEELDELKRARQYMKDARKHNWHGPNLPIQDWEKL